MFEDGRRMGQLTSGSLSRGLEMQLDPAYDIEDLRAGRFVVVRGQGHDFFSMITDVALGSNPSEAAQRPIGDGDGLLREILHGTSTYGTVTLRPMLMLPRNGNGDEKLPVKTIPGHFSGVLEATQEDVERVFGEEDEDGQFFRVGAPLDMEEIPVCLDLERFVERSNAVFGKSGTGKTFLTRVVLCGVLKSKRATMLLFDMHNEYGWEGRIEGDERGEVRGLAQYFGDRVCVYSLDPKSSMARKVPNPIPVRIPYSQVTVEDIALLEDELNLSGASVETAYALSQRLGRQWLAKLLDMTPEDIKEFSDAHQGALSALQRHLRTLVLQCQEFLRPDSELAREDDGVINIMNAVESGTSVVLEFGHHRKPVQYMLVANILTRRIHDRYVDKTEKALADRDKVQPLVIGIEEAHKFLNPKQARQSIFGTIAREMRKYNVTLLVVDQRPSGIDAEVLSQIGTKLVCLLDDDRDIDAALSGVSGGNALKGVLASLETKQQALLLGHSVPMPIVVKTRTYDDDAFRKAMGACVNIEEVRERGRAAREAMSDPFE